MNMLRYVTICTIYHTKARQNEHISSAFLVVKMCGSQKWTVLRFLVILKLFALVNQIDAERIQINYIWDFKTSKFQTFWGYYVCWWFDVWSNSVRFGDTCLTLVYPTFAWQRRLDSETLARLWLFCIKQRREIESGRRKKRLGAPR